ncbi:MAG TPA: glycosyltransferase family 39 protein [Steroidobacteraceae bacterium]|nr:glycosyltransferase family 39 protein [Steroidobacteraceae bacterium]
MRTEVPITEQVLGKGSSAWTRLRERTAAWLSNMASLFEATGPNVRVDARTLMALAAIVGVGAFLRFWGLDNVGLHGDEKTMALPAMHLLRYGTPEMPSGFTYPRAITQLYLMAWSMRLFGVSEWALRFPSAVCGVLLIPLAWVAGRRFLGMRWSLALAAVVALLPAFIQDAQTARMYVFLVTGVAGFMALLFAWERTGKVGFLVAAVIEMAVTLEFHTLAIFADWLCFLPGLLAGDSRRLRQGAIAFVVIAAEFGALNHWIGQHYPHAADALAVAVSNAPRAPGAGRLDPTWAVVIFLPAVALSWYAVRSRGWLPVVLLTTSLLAQVSRLDHLAILLIIAALVIARRDGRLSPSRLGGYFGVCVLIAGLQIEYGLVHHVGKLTQICGLLLGWPSVRPWIAISQLSWAAVVIAAAGVAVGLRRLALRRRIPPHLLLFALGVWLPMLQIGLFAWDVPPRYTGAQIVPLLMVALATLRWGAQRLSELLARRSAPAHGRAMALTAAALVCLLVIDPTQLEAAVAPSYRDYPDHKGAAQFVESQRLKPADIIVAEDALMQKFYLGRIDYWLQARNMAAPFLSESGGRWVDMYTGAPLIGTGAQLERLVKGRDRGAIYVIGSGEEMQDGRKMMRGLGIAQVLRSSAFHLVYVGRDRVTDVWKVDPPRHQVATASVVHGR